MGTTGANHDPTAEADFRFGAVHLSNICLVASLGFSVVVGMVASERPCAGWSFDVRLNLLATMLAAIAVARIGAKR